jgi:hypothetical protein
LNFVISTEIQAPQMPVAGDGTNQDQKLRLYRFRARLKQYLGQPRFEPDRILTNSESGQDRHKRDSFSQVGKPWTSEEILTNVQFGNLLMSAESFTQDLVTLLVSVRSHWSISPTLKSTIRNFECDQMWQSVQSLG